MVGITQLLMSEWRQMGAALQQPGRAWRTYRRLLQESVTGNYTSHGHASHADCAVAFCSSAQANQDMAWTYLPELRKRRPNLPFVASPEILDLYQHERETTGEPLYPLPHSEGTYETALDVLAIMRAEGWQQPLMVALNRHVPRMDAVFRRLDCQTIVPADLAGIRLTTTDRSHEARWRRKQPRTIGLYVLLHRVAFDA